MEKKMHRSVSKKSRISPSTSYAIWHNRLRQSSFFFFCLSINCITHTQNLCTHFHLICLCIIYIDLSALEYNEKRRRKKIGTGRRDKKKCLHTYIYIIESQRVRERRAKRASESLKCYIQIAASSQAGSISSESLNCHCGNEDFENSRRAICCYIHCYIYIYIYIFNGVQAKCIPSEPYSLYYPGI